MRSHAEAPSRKGGDPRRSGNPRDLVAAKAAPTRPVSAFHGRVLDLEAIIGMKEGFDRTSRGQGTGRERFDEAQ